MYKNNRFFLALATVFLIFGVGVTTAKAATSDESINAGPFGMVKKSSLESGNAVLNYKNDFSFPLDKYKVDTVYVPTDFDPVVVQGMQGIKHFYMTQSGSSLIRSFDGMGSSVPSSVVAHYSQMSRNNFSDLNFLLNQNELESIDLQLVGGQRSVTDISALSYLPKLKEVRINNMGSYLPAINLKKGTTSFSMPSPVVLSKQFDGADINVRNINDGAISSEQDNTIWKFTGINNSDSCLLFMYTATNGNYSYSDQFRLPINWVD